MAVKNRGLRSEAGGYFSQIEFEIVHSDAASWCRGKPVLSEWVRTLDTADTGERSGLSQSSWGSAGDADQRVEEEGLPSGDRADCFDGEGIAHSPVPLPRLTHSAKQYACMMNAGMLEMPVHTGAERQKYLSELPDNLYCAGDQMGRLQKHQQRKSR